MSPDDRDAPAGARVRPATVADDAALRAVDVASWSGRVSPGRPPEPGSAFLDERTRPEDVLVAEVDGTVAGYVLLQQAIDLPSHAHVLTVNGLAVDPTRQRAGLGRLLVDAAVAEAARRGARKVTLRVLGGNTGAQALYAACGFVVEGRLAGEFVIDGVEVDDLLLARWVGGAPSGAAG